MTILVLIDEKWMPYCDSTPNIPAHVSVLQLLPIIMCGVIGMTLFVQFVRHAMGRIHFTTSIEFGDANRRIINRIPLLEARQGEDLRRLCRFISRDLLRVTSFVANDIGRCIYEYDSKPLRDQASALLRENTLLRLNAIQIGVLYHIKPLKARMVKQTNKSVELFARTWLPLLEQYCLTICEAADSNGTT